MKSFPLKMAVTVLGAIAVIAVPFVPRSQALDEMACLDEFEGIELSSSQVSQLDQLEKQFDEQLDQIMPLSPEDEAKWNQLEEDFERQVEALLSPQQIQQIEALDTWADERILAIAPELFDDEAEVEIALTPTQEADLDTLEEEYDQRFFSILTPEQQQQIEALEIELDETIETELFDLSPEQEARLESVEADFEQQMLALLSADQRQQFEQNLASCEFSGN